MKPVVPLLAAVALSLTGWLFFSSERTGTTGTEKAAEHDEQERTPDELEPATPTQIPARVAPETTEPEPRAAGYTEEHGTEGASARVLLTIVEDGTGEPLPGFRLAMVTQLSSVGFTADARGIVEFKLDLRRRLFAFEHVADPSHERFHEPWEFVEDSLLVDLEATDGTLEKTLRAMPPAARITVEAVRASGSPATGAEVQMTQGTFLDGVTRWHRWRLDETDERGIARFYLHHASDLDDSFTVSLRHPLAGEVSDVLAIGPPLDAGPHRLVLYAGSELDVFVIDEDDRPLPGLQVRIGSFTPTRRLHVPIVLTDDQGLARFGPLPAERVVVYASRPNTRKALAERELEIERESAQTVHLVISAEALVEHLIVSGHVVDAAGEPVHNRMLAVSLDGAQPERVFSGEDGRFELKSLTRAEQVTVQALASVYGPGIQPETITVAAGTKNLEFRELADPGEAVVIFEIVDALTGEPLPDEDDVAIRVYRVPDEGERIVATAAFGPDEGMTEVDFGRLDGLHWLVTAPGYRERRGTLELPEEEGDPPILRVEMERGFRRAIVVRDQLTAEALAGVAVVDDDGNRLATTGFDGRVVIESREWLEWLTLELDGYEPLRWRARSHWFWYSDRFWLEPLR